MEFNEKILQKLLAREEKVLFACIGTDRSTGDALGPLVGTALSKLGYKVIGTLHDPLHAVNLRQRLEDMQKNYPEYLIVAIDSCLSSSDRIGMITVKAESIKPGLAVGKDLPSVGDVGIRGMVNVGGFMEHAVLQSTRLSKVIDLADEITQMCDLAMKRRKSKIKRPTVIGRKKKTM